MKILVYPAMMEIGGSQLNAIELAAQMTREGHEVVMYAPAGELNEVAAAQGVEIVRSPCNERWPTVASLVGLLRLVRARGIEIVHAYEWGPSVETALGPYGLLGVPMITTVLSMDVPWVVPTRPLLIVGTAELAAEQDGLRTARLAEPWIDTEANAPHVTDTAATRSDYGFGPDDLVLAVVCRLTEALEKIDGVLVAMEMVRRWNDLRRDGEPPLRLLVVGDGDCLARARDRADDLNPTQGRPDIVVTGPLLDPRPVYDVADIVLGMGSSALKGLSFGKPLIVQGVGGYWESFGPETVQIFDHQGFFGHADRSWDEAVEILRDHVVALTELNATAHDQLSGFGRAYIESRFSLKSAAATHLRWYDEVVALRPTAASRLSTLGRTLREATKLNLAHLRDAARHHIARRTLITTSREHR